MRLQWSETNEALVQNDLLECRSQRAQVSPETPALSVHTVERAQRLVAGSALQQFNPRETHITLKT